MKSHEGITQASVKVEREGEELPVSSFEDVGADITNENLAEYAHTSEMQVQNEATEIVPEGEKRIEATAQGMNVSPEMLNETKQEFGLDTKLQEVQSEADQIVAETKSEIASVTGDNQSEQIEPVKEKTPEEIKNERKTAIIKEIEAEWEAKNGPMERPLSKREIEENKYRDEAFGGKWDGRTTQMSDRANEFYFDHRGMGKSSVPSQADKILAERFPEYAQSKEETEMKVVEVEKTTEQAKPIQTLREGGGESSRGLQEVFRQANIETKKLSIEGDTEFPEAIILEKQEVPREKLVRIFRGINHLDSSLLEQVPYAMRKESGTGKPVNLEEVRGEVETLAKNPTYENLLAYSEKVRPYLSSEEVARLDDDVTSVEEEILEGTSTRKSLLYKQIGHNGGWGDSGATPYISASFDPYEAVGYGNEGLMVLDVPLSEVEDFSPDGKEVGIKGALDKKYITAVIPRKINRQGGGSKDETNKQLYQTLLKVYETTDAPLLNAEELRSMRETKSVEVAVLDKNQWEKDVAVVRQKRIKKLVAKFPEVGPNMQAVQEKSIEEGVDVYTGVKRYVFDQYKSRLGKIGRNGRDVTEYDFSTSQYGERKKFDRENVTDVMLLKLRELVDRLEEREEEREKNRDR